MQKTILAAVLGLGLSIVVAGPVLAQSIYDIQDRLNPRDGVPLTPLEIQAALAATNIDPGPLDGVIGGQTRAALAELARRHGFSYNGGAIAADMHQHLYFSLVLALGGDGCEGC